MPLTITTLRDEDAQPASPRPTKEPIHLWRGTVDDVSATVVVLSDSSTDGRARSDVYHLYLSDDVDPAATLEVDVDTSRVMGRIGFGSGLPSGHTAVEALTQIVRAHRGISMD